MRDFTFSAYRKLLEELLGAGYTPVPLRDYPNVSPCERCVILRHDVDRAPGRAEIVAGIERELGVRASYYFRVVPESWDEKIIVSIAGMGHEVGYHYEDLTLARGDVDRAWELFESNLNRLRELVDVKTAAMHGSPASPWDNRNIWQRHDYRTLGISCEPYMDLDFQRIFYITDAGRGWNCARGVLRDHVRSDLRVPVIDSADIGWKACNGALPDHIMINMHPHNWSPGGVDWMKILLWQGLKNQIKQILALTRRKET